MNDPQHDPDSGTRCRKELEFYIVDLGENVLDWYERDANRQYRWWFSCFWVSIAAGFVSSLIAALVKGGALTAYGPIALIVLPALGSLAGLILSQLHFRELEDLRERGRIEIQDIIDWARGQLAAADGEARCLAVYEELRKKVKDLEMQQHEEFTRITGPKKPARTGSRG